MLDPTRYYPFCSNETASQPKVNSIAEFISLEMSQAFSGYVLPHRTDDKPTFSPNEAKCNYPAPF